MSFVRSGYVYSGFGSLRLMGSDGYLWTLSVLAGALQTSYESAFDVTGVYPTSYRDWVYGLADCNDFYMFSYISFVRSGYVNAKAGTVLSVGANGSVWSETAIPSRTVSTGAYYLFLSMVAVRAPHRDNRSMGFVAKIKS